MHSNVCCDDAGRLLAPLRPEEQPACDTEPGRQPGNYLVKLDINVAKNGRHAGGRKHYGKRLFVPRL